MPTICRGPKPATANYSFKSHPITDGSNIYTLARRVIGLLLNDAAENYPLYKDRGQQLYQNMFQETSFPWDATRILLIDSGKLDAGCAMHVCVLIAQSCPTLCDLMDYSPPGPAVQGVLQARIVEWVSIPFRGSSRLRD